MEVIAASLAAAAGTFRWKSLPKLHKLGKQRLKAYADVIWDEQHGLEVAWTHPVCHHCCYTVLYYRRVPGEIASFKYVRSMIEEN